MSNPKPRDYHARRAWQNAALDHGFALAVGGEDEPLTLPPLTKE